MPSATWVLPVGMRTLAYPATNGANASWSVHDPQIFIRSIFSRSARKIDYASFADVELRRLWKERAQLTEDARDLLSTEVAQRKLFPKANEDHGGHHAHRKPPQKPTPAYLRGPRVEVVSPCVVGLRTEGNRGILCVLPMQSADTHWQRSFKMPDLDVAGIIVFNQSPGGFLPTSFVVSSLDAIAKRASAGLKLWALDPTRLAEPSTLDSSHFRFKRLPERLEMGFLTLERIGLRTDTVRATWPVDDNVADDTGRLTRVLIGPLVTFHDIAWRKADAVIGGVSLRERDGDSVLNALATLKQVVLMRDVEGVCGEGGAIIAQLGVDVTTVGSTP